MAQKYGAAAESEEEHELVHMRHAPPREEMGPRGTTALIATAVLIIVLLIGILLQLQHFEPSSKAAASSGPVESSSSQSRVARALECYSEVDREQQELIRQPDFMANQGFEIGFHLNKQMACLNSIPHKLGTDFQRGRFLLERVCRRDNC